MYQAYFALGKSLVFTGRFETEQHREALATLRSGTGRRGQGRRTVRGASKRAESNYSRFTRLSIPRDTQLKFDNTNTVLKTNCKN